MTEQPAVQCAFVSLIILLSVFTWGQVAASASNYSPHAPVVIKGNSNFTSLSGVTSGSGTLSDPYVIQGWAINASSVNGITIVNSTAHFVIRGVNIFGGILGIFLDNATNGIVESSSISSDNVGVRIDQSPGTTISKNQISNNNIGLLLQNSTGVTISSNNLLQNQKGILVRSSPWVTVSGNSLNSTPTESQNPTWISSMFIYGQNFFLYDAEAGVFLDASDHSNISNNTVFLKYVLYPGTGPSYIPVDFHTISLKFSSYARVYNNTLSSLGGDGINLYGSPLVTIFANNVTHSQLGILLNGSRNVTVSGNNLSRNSAEGVLVDEYSVNATVTSNRISFNGGYGLSCCPGNAVVTGNVFTVNGLLLRTLADGPHTPTSITTFYASLKIGDDNLVNGKPVAFYRNCANMTIDGISAGEFIIANCQNLRISHLQVTYTDIGIQLIDATNVLITSNSFNSNTHYGITISQDTCFVPCTNNVTIVGNNLSNNGWQTCCFGAVLYLTGVHVYHNNFIYDSLVDYVVSPQQTIFDIGYPSGGNYWSSYMGVDRCSGPSQNICPDPDNIGDTPFTFQDHDRPAVDHYPLMTPYLPTPDRFPPIWPTSLPLTTSFLNPTNVTLAWMPATDDVGVVTYRVYQGTTLVANLTADQFSYVVRGLSPNTSYTFSVQAVDWSGNTSMGGPSVTLTTPAATNGTSWVLYWIVILPMIIGVSLVTTLVLYRKRRKVELRTDAGSGTP